ncbi:hypothetical protein Tgr7_0390 [Thioalkalivibrio sulfidiphilus HL-EbGr7]|uniref:DUF7210 domain-containing protein n=1 Tax=Thioalkalivibrio sulfidiphilus (strain HL-EbGR7) TaxID=396588 RepID=B8GUX7_THISH|nr:hypothetical protein [Thioalkalivibrio sulfidiphilus]ACL71488.1 hypothetical protein Tgr7_0390 [Thioalkalivibrio sulfidiphilus HL-EbGr7]
MSTKSETKKPEAKTVSVTLIAPHTHHGTHYTPGQTIQVREHLVPWLARHRVIEAPAQTKE